MDLDLTDEQRGFQKEVRTFINERLPSPLRRKMRLGQEPSREDLVNWQRTLHERGWAAPHWPKSCGGAGLGSIEKVLLQEELYRAPAPQPLSFNVTMLGPVLLRFGSSQQQDHWLPKLANLDVWFCQGFSEPGAGSDLASLRTSARREGDQYVVDGQKIWTTTAHWADWIFCLVRTSREARRQEGISMLLIDLRSPGITIRPIRSIDGRHHFNEIFFDQVRVPAGQLVGEEGRGWDITRFLLGNERTLIAKVGFCLERLDRARELLAQGLFSRQEADRLRDEIATLHAETRALAMIQWQMINLGNDENSSARFASVLKLKGTETQQRIAALLLRLEGPHGMRLEPLGAGYSKLPEVSTAGSYYHYVRATTIYGGSSEIQRELLNRGMF